MPQKSAQSAVISLLIIIGIIVTGYMLWQGQRLPQTKAPAPIHPDGKRQRPTIRTTRHTPARPKKTKKPTQRTKAKLTTTPPPKRTKAKAIPRLAPKPKKPENPCRRIGRRYHWIYGRLLKPKGKRPRVRCRKRAMPTMRTSDGFCIGIPHRSNFRRCETSLPGYQPCKHPLNGTMKAIEWTLQRRDQGVVKDCFSRNK